MKPQMHLKTIFSTGEAYCEARLIYDGLEIQPGQSLGDLYQGFEKYSISGLPMPLPDKPLITQMSDTHVTLTWKPGEFCRPLITAKKNKESLNGVFTKLVFANGEIPTKDNSEHLAEV